MLVAVAGDTHGALDRLYEIVQLLEREAGRPVDAVLQVGDFGVWPDPARLDAATRKHGDRGEFRRLQGRGGVPWPTWFIAGNHEDFQFLLTDRGRQMPPGLRFLPWGEVATIEAGGERLRVGGIGGCYGPRDFERTLIEGAARRHYTRADLERLERGAAEPIDVLLLHEPPAGPVTELHAPPGFSPRSWNLKGPGLAELVVRVRPRVCFTGHIHARTERRLDGVRTVGLHKVPHRGSVILLEIAPGAAPPVDVAEWGGAPEVPDSWQEVPVDDPVVVEALARALEAWGAAVIGGRPLGRDERKQIHAVLAGTPQRTALMGVLRGRDPVEVVEEEIPASERASLLTLWSAGGLPEPATLRR